MYALPTHPSEAKLIIDKQRESLVHQVRKALESGLSIAVVGWRDSNHSQFSRKLSKKKVIFFDNSPSDIPEKVGLVLFTKFVDHAVVHRIKRKKSCYPIVVETGQIKGILESCRDLLVQCQCSSTIAETRSVATTEPPAMAPIEPEMDYDVLDFLTTPRKGHQMNNIEKFAEAFLVAAKANMKKPDHVGKMELGKLRRTYGIKETNGQLANNEWLLGEVSEGREHVGWYKAGPKMLEAVKQDKFEPDDPYKLAKFLIAQKPEILAQKAEIEKRLARIETAEKALEQLEALMKPK